MKLIEVNIPQSILCLLITRLVVMSYYTLNLSIKFEYGCITLLTQIIKLRGCQHVYGHMGCTYSSFLDPKKKKSKIVYFIDLLCTNGTNFEWTTNNEFDFLLFLILFN